MRIGERHPNSGQWPRLFLVLTVLYLSQIYPYIHFHHSHELSDNPSALGLIFQDSNSDNFSDSRDWHNHGGYVGHGGEDSHRENGDGHHHHHLFDQHIDCFRIRSNARSIPVFPDLSALPICSNLKDIEKSVSVVYTSEEDTLPECIPIGPIYTRGPPVLS